MATIRWGIVGAGKISHDFVNAVNDPKLPALAGNKIIAVASRLQDRAQAFADNHGITTVYGSYEQLAAHSDIDIVYVANPVGHHYETCKMMLNAGKHVLCEKTLTPCAAQSRDLFELAKRKNLFMMEALWSNLVPSYKFVKQQIALGTIGQVRHVQASFGKIAPQVAAADRGGGATFDLGVYLINLVLQVFGREWPEKIIANGDLHSAGVDASWDAMLVYEAGRRAVLSCSSTCALNNTAIISGTKGNLELVAPFHITPRVKLPTGSHDFPYPQESRHKYNFPNSSGLAYEAAAVADAVRSGDLQVPEYTAEDSLYVTAIMAEIRKQIGV